MNARCQSAPNSARPVAVARPGNAEVSHLPHGPMPCAERDRREPVAERWRLLGASEAGREALADEGTLAKVGCFSRNIENFIGTVKVPAGIAGPLRVNGTRAQGDYYLPLATTEGALVASYDRGARLITEAGGCAAALLAEGVSRAPGFAFASLAEAARFASWVETQFLSLIHISEPTRH